MKRAFMLILVLAILVINACTQKVDIEAEKANVRLIFDKIIKVWEEEDINLAEQIFAKDDDLLFFGTDAAERWVGWESLKVSMQRQFESYADSKMTMSNITVGVSSLGNTAWVSSILDWELTAMGEPVEVNGMRFTGVLEKRNDKWLFVQLHASLPVMGQVVEY